MNTDNSQLDSLSEKVLGAVFEVANTLGPDFWKNSTSGRCYQNSASAACGRPRKLHLQ